jgi:hypothetical protein
MAYREVTMLEVKEVLRLWLLRVPNKQIGKQLGFDVKTVRRYLGAAKARGVEQAHGLDALDDELVAAVVAATQPASGRPRGEGWAVCEAHREFIAGHIAHHVRLTKVGKLLRRRGVAIEYPTLRRFALAELGFGRGATSVSVADCEPGSPLEAGEEHCSKLTVELSLEPCDCARIGCSVPQFELPVIDTDGGVEAGPRPRTPTRSALRHELGRATPSVDDLEAVGLRPQLDRLLDSMLADRRQELVHIEAVAVEGRGVDLVERSFCTGSVSGALEGAFFAGVAFLAGVLLVLMGCPPISVAAPRRLFPAELPHPTLRQPALRRLPHSEQAQVTHRLYAITQQASQDRASCADETDCSAR